MDVVVLGDNDFVNPGCVACLVGPIEASSPADAQSADRREYAIGLIEATVLEDAFNLAPRLDLRTFSIIKGVGTGMIGICPDDDLILGGYRQKRLVWLLTACWHLSGCSTAQ
jgi:hypothetical protein